MMDTAEKPAAAQNPIPLWLAVTVLSTILVGGLAVIWKYAYRPSKPPNLTRIIAPTPTNPRVAGGDAPADERTKAAVLKAAAESELPEGLHARATDDVLVKAGDTYMRVAPRNGQEPGYSFGYFTIAEREWEHGYLTQSLRRIAADEEYAKELGITPDQAKRLEALPAAPSSKWPEPDRKRFIDAYQAWSRAADPEKPKAAEELVRALKEFGERHRADDDKQMATRIDQIKSILTERQLAKVNPVKR
jgi:hypothetical protein